MVLIPIPILYLTFTLPFIHLSSEHLTRTDRIHPDLNIIVKDNSWTFFTSSLTKALLEYEFFWIAIKISICRKTSHNIVRVTLATGATSTHFHDFTLHTYYYRKKGEK